MHSFALLIIIYIAHNLPHHLLPLNFCLIHHKASPTHLNAIWAVPVSHYFFLNDFIFIVGSNVFCWLSIWMMIYMILNFECLDGYVLYLLLNRLLYRLYWLLVGSFEIFVFLYNFAEHLKILMILYFYNIANIFIN